MNYASSSCLVICLFILRLPTCNPSEGTENSSATSTEYVTKPVDSIYQFSINDTDSAVVRLKTQLVDSNQVVVSIVISNGQNFDFNDEDPRFLEYTKFESLDLNFDGYNDFRILKDAGATGNAWFDTWLYNAKQKSWIRNSFLSNACSVSVDSVNKRVLTEYWGGWDTQFLSAYTVSDTTYEIVEDWWAEPHDGSLMIHVAFIKNSKVIYSDSMLSKITLKKLYTKLHITKRIPDEVFPLPNN